MTKTSGENFIDALNTQTFLQILGKEPKEPVCVEKYRQNRAEYLSAYDFFMSLPYLSPQGREELAKAMVKLIEKAQGGENDCIR